MARIFLLLCVCAFMSALPARSAGDFGFSSQPYKASYETSGDAYSLVTRMTYDGHGNLKIETIQNHETRTQIYLLAKDSTYMLRDDRVALKLDMPAHAWDPFIRDWRHSAPAGLVALSAREVCEHPSHGFTGKAAGIDGEIWIADDISIPTMQKTNATDGPMTLQLVDYKKLDPSQTVALAIPDGYSVTTSGAYMEQEKSQSPPSNEMSPEVTAKFAKYGKYLESVIGKRWLSMKPKYNELEIKEKTVAVINFRVNFDGSISDVHTGKSSGNLAFDDVAIEAVKTAPKLVPLPPGGLKCIETHFTFSYKPVSLPATNTSAAAAGNHVQVGSGVQLGSHVTTGDNVPLSNGGSSVKAFTIPTAIPVPGVPIAVRLPYAGAITGVARLLSAAGSSAHSKTNSTAGSSGSPLVGASSTSEPAAEQAETKPGAETDAIKKSGRHVQVVGESQFPGKGSREEWEKAARLHDEGADLLVADRLDEAIDKIQGAVLLYPDDYCFYNTLGVAYRHRDKPGDKDLAEHAFKKSLNLRNDDLMVWDCLGRLYEDQGKLVEAKNAYLKALSLNPSVSKAEELRVKIQRCQNNTNK